MSVLGDCAKVAFSPVTVVGLSVQLSLVDIGIIFLS